VVLVPILSADVVDCKGLPQKYWITREVTLINEARDDIAKTVCQSVDVDLIIDMDGKPFGDNCNAV